MVGIGRQECPESDEEIWAGLRRKEYLKSGRGMVGMGGGCWDGWSRVRKCGEEREKV
jgi:hypothetical protein